MADELRLMLHSEPTHANGIRQRMHLTTVFFIINIVAFYRLRNSCPGFALPDAEPFEEEDDDVEKLLMDSSKAKFKRGMFCEQCRVEQNLKVKHCRVCQQCILGWDHHCVWVGTCIGIENHRYFLLYLGSQTLCTILALDLLITAKFDLADSFPIWIILILFLVFSLIIIGGLFVWHSVCALSGCTTRELMNFGGNIGEEEDQKVGACTRCSLSLEGFISGRPPKTLKKRQASGSPYRFLETCDYMCDNPYFSCF
jgi:hypothetical protein